MGGETVESILKFLEDGTQRIRFSSSREAVLILGTTGTGKTTLTHFLALNNELMRSVEKGQGNYIIQDDTEQICEATIQSCTVIPELVIDQSANKTVYYDFPGFSDTRSVAYDIGVTYFIQKVIQRADAVKLVFTTSYDSVRQGGDRLAFMNLAKYVYSMFKDVEKFNRSICLAVTKVDNVMEEVGDDEYRLVPDEAMIQNIASFLKEARDDVEAKLKKDPPTEDKQYYQSTSTFINAILNENEPGTPRIGIFRRPNKPGPLSKNKSLQKGRAHLREMIYDKLGYTVCQPTDFGYTISDNSILYLNDLKDGINEKISTKISDIGQQLIIIIQKQEKESRNIDNTVVYINLLHDKLSKLSLAGDTSAREFAKKLVQLFDELGIDIPGTQVTQLFNYCGYLEFVESLMKQKTGPPINWGHSLKDTVNYLEGSGKWYSLLIDLRTTLSSYFIQQDLESYISVKNQLLADLSPGNQKSVKGNLSQLLFKVNEYASGGKLVVPENVDLDLNKLRFLKELMEGIFLETDIHCLDGNLVAKGGIVNMKDVVSNTPCFIHSQTVEIHALNKVFFDADFEKKSGVLFIFTPELEVIDSHGLVLDGEQGRDQEEAAARGQDGKPGNPGGSAGSLVVIGQKCTNCKELSVSAVGGKGGRGQDGGKGVDGDDGRSPPDLSTSVKSCDYDVWTSEGFEFSFTEFIAPNFDYYKTFIVYGDDGVDGRTGGNGGAGGLAGLDGIFWGMINITSSWNPTMKPVGPTGVGDGGKGGEGGNGGWHGGTLVERAHCEDACLTANHYACEFVERIDGGYRANPGNNGADNANAEGRKSPEPITFNAALALSQYKNYLRQNMANPITITTLENFLQFIETDSNVAHLYGIKELADDLLTMESQKDSAQETKLQVRSYRNFLHRIVEHPLNPNMDDLKLVREYLYAVISSKISRIKENTSRMVVVDIKGYLQLIKEDIKQLENYRTVVERTKSKADYQSKIRNKIAEAESIVANHILPNIDSAIEHLRDDMRSLLNETIALEKKAEAEEKLLIEKRHQLESQMRISVVLGMLQGVGQVLGFLGPVGAMVGATIGVATTVASNVLVNNASGDDVISKLPEGIETLLNNFMDQFQKKQELYQSELKKAKEMLADAKDDSNVISNLKTKIDQIQTDLDESSKKALNGDKTAIKRCYALKKDLNKALNESVELLKKQKQTPSGKSNAERCIKVVSRIQNVVSVADIGVGIYENVKHSEDSIKTLDEAIENKHEEIRKLKEYEEMIYTTMLPIINGIKDTVYNAVKTSTGKSHAALDVSSWEVQSALRDVQKTLKELTSGFTTQGDIVDNIDKTMYAMTTMMKVYDRIQEYHDQAQLADLISDLTSEPAQNIQVTDVHLQGTINKLQFQIQYNVVLAKYFQSMSAVKQYMFPFGSYVDSYSLPVELRAANSSNDIPQMVDNIVTVLEKLKPDVTVITSKDENIFPNQKFNSLDKERPPFFVRKCSTSQELIRNLLQGKEVMMYADITRGIQQNAIKFDGIGIYIRAHCNKLQNYLNEALDGFSIQLTHLGNSYYTCGKKTFMMTHDSVLLEHSVNKKNGTYYNQNEAYVKIGNNDPLLSPYGMWKMKLVGGDVTKLANFVGFKVDIELEGTGSYLNHKEDNTRCTDDLKQYYEDVTDSLNPIISDDTNAAPHDDVDECENDEVLAVSSNTPDAKKRTTSDVVNGFLHYLDPIKHIFGNTSGGTNTTINHNTNHRGLVDGSSTLLTTPYSHNTTNTSDSTIQSVGYNAVDLQGSLLLIDTLLHKFNGTKRSHSPKANLKDDEYAQMMAYNAYAP